MLCVVSYSSPYRDLIPPDRLRTYDQPSSDGLFKALRADEIDVAVFNQSIFAEKRYSHEYFDLKVGRAACY